MEAHSPAAGSRVQGLEFRGQGTHTCSRVQGLELWGQGTQTCSRVQGAGDYSAHPTIRVQGAGDYSAHPTIRVQGSGDYSAHPTIRVQGSGGRGLLCPSPRALISLNLLRTPPNGQDTVVIVHYGQEGLQCCTPCRARPHLPRGANCAPPPPFAKVGVYK